MALTVNVGRFRRDGGLCRDAGSPRADAEETVIPMGGEAKEAAMGPEDAPHGPPPARHYRTDRTEGISDGVFAVALTLLILDVKLPEGGVNELVHNLGAIAPRLGTFALSFAIVAYYWLVHHMIFESVRAVKGSLIWANMLFLLSIVV